MTHSQTLAREIQRIVQFVLLATTILSLAACAVGPKYKTPALPAPPAYREMGNWKTAQPSDQKLGGNWWELFQDPQLNALEQEINVSNQNLKAAVAQYQESRAALLQRETLQLLEQLKTYVQTVADASASDSEGIIQSAGMAVRKTAVRAPRVFNAVQGDVSGSVKLVTASAGHRAAYNWQYSLDGGKTWVVIPSTLQAKTTVAGLTAGTTVEFRYQALTKTGEGNWSQVVSLLVK